ncbi:nuclear factor NF-kappa-B p110 subunit [Drosophila ficusphila]|uniref:nuclear factor NF-kappa-B p110 subunit n=1 Tax=Drosophila ficusphila TaxID=30025 RepID=UPI0007E85130|nr:nuclear factor NF-kappa-B p110 subunit [Drosophila ficusphila]
MNQYYDLDKGKNIMFLNDASSTSGYSSGNSPTSTTQSLSPAHSPETMALQTDFANLNLPAGNSPQPPPPLLNPPYQHQLLNNGALCQLDASNLINSTGVVNATNFGTMYMDHQYYVPSSAVEPPGQHFGYHQNGLSSGGGGKHVPHLRIVEQPVEKFRFRYKSEMHGTHGSLNGANSKRTPKTFPEVQLYNYDGPAVIRCSLFQTNLDSPHSHQLVVRKDERDVCDPHDLHVSKDRGYVAQFINMGIIHTAKKFIRDELFKKKQDRLVFQMNRRELSTKQIQELHQETEREAKDMNLNQVRLCFEAFKIEDNGTWVTLAPPVYSNAINNRKSAQTGELRIVRLSKPTGGVMGNDELILLVEKVSKKNIKVRFFEEDEDGETVWEAYAKFRESDVHHQYAIVCQTPAYKDKDVDREVNVSIELIRPSDDERSFPPLPFRYKPRDAIVSRKRRRTCSSANSSSSGNVSSNNSLDLPKTLAMAQPPNGLPNFSQHDQTISQEFGRETHLDDLINSENFRKLIENNSEDLEKICQLDMGELQADGHGRSEMSTGRSLTTKYLNAIFKIFDQDRRTAAESSRRRVEELFTDHALNNDNNDTLLHEVISYKKDNLKLAFKTLQVMNFFKLRELVNSALNADGDSALHVACQQDRPHYIRPLLSLGCSPNQQNHAGNTPLHLAVKEERINCVESFLNGMTNVRLDLSLKNDDGLTPLHMAIRQNKYDVAKKLISHDRSSMSVANTMDGNNALHMAVLEQSVELLVLILDAQGQNLNDILQAQNAAGYTPLELARYKANERVVQLLEKVYPEKSELAMTWIPRKVKEEIDSSSDESSDAGQLEIKSEDMDIKTEDCDSVELDLSSGRHRREEESSGDTEMMSDPRHKLQLRLRDKSIYNQLSSLLNKPVEHGPDGQLPKWKLLARQCQLEQYTFLWLDADGLLDHIKDNASSAEIAAFGRALHTIDPQAHALLDRDLL